MKNHSTQNGVATREDVHNGASTELSQLETYSFLRTLAASRPSARLLELGSGIGLSTACLLAGMDSISYLAAVDNDEAKLALLRQRLGKDPRLTIACADGDVFLRAARGQRFDFIFANTCSGKYRLLDETLALLNPGGLYVINGMSPQPDWPESGREKNRVLLARLEQRSDIRLAKFAGDTDVIVAIKY
ncbi:MAG: methyltransferase domain-containing protein [Pseudomonadota bacterium]